MSDIEEEDPTSLACICSTIQVSYLNLQCMWGKGRGEKFCLLAICIYVPVCLSTRHIFRPIRASTLSGDPSTGRTALTVPDIFNFLHTGARIVLHTLLLTVLACYITLILRA